jgi:thiol-disulfide isomerase/thioredoxin
MSPDIGIRTEKFLSSRRLAMRLRHLCGALIVLGIAAGVCVADEPKPTQSAKKPSIYDKNADAKAQVDAARARAERGNKRVLLMFGGDWCGWCHKLHDLFAKDAEIRKLLSYEYELVMVDTAAPHAPELLKECSEGQSGVGFPFLAVLDAKGKLLVGQKTDPLEEKDHHDPVKVKDFLARWVVPPTDAHAALRSALDRASADDKKVFLTFGAPWCGWCHKLEDFLARPEIGAIMARDFVVQKIDIDRMTSGKDILKTYRADESGGIPWFVVLDAKGEKLSTSDLLPGPVKNIGYPAEPKEIDAFMGVIEKQSRRIPSDQIAQLRRELTQAGQKIVADMKARADAARAKPKAN